MGTGDELQELRQEVARLRREVAEVRCVVGPACISLADAEGRQRVSISLDDDGAPSLQLWNENRPAR